MRLNLLVAISALAMAALAARAEASAIIVVKQVGSDVVITGSGTLDLIGLDYQYSTYAPTEVLPSLNTVLIGTDAGHVDVYSGITTYPASLGTGGTTAASSGAGDTFGINDMVLDVPFGYTSGSPLLGSSTFDNQTIASLGFTPGTYVFSWNSSVVGTAVTDDSVTVEVGSAVPEPSTWAMMLLGFAGLGLVGYRASRRAAAAA
jgi:PEP-CTERM motif